MISRNGNYEFSINDEYIRDAAGRPLTDDQCYEVAQYIDDNIFDYIAEVVEVLDFEEEGEDEE
jgi:hypothetical protein